MLLLQIKSHGRASPNHALHYPRGAFVLTCCAQVGYDNVQQYWLAKNSYGNTWGDGGLFKVPAYDSNMQCCVAPGYLIVSLCYVTQLISVSGMFCLLIP
jgi:C1A family cysteine protease